MQMVPEADRRIVRVLAVRDTRAWDPDRECRVPGTGEEHDCDRCGRPHEVWVEVELASGGTATVGTTCAARADEAALIRRAVTSARTLDRLEHQLVAAEADLAAVQRILDEVEALPRPPVEGPVEGISPVLVGTVEKGRTVWYWYMGDARVWVHEPGPELRPERKLALENAWFNRRLHERLEAAGLPEPCVAFTRVEGLRRRVDRARRRVAEAAS